MRRDQGLAAFGRNEREMRRDDPALPAPEQIRQRRKPGGQGGDIGRGESSAAIGASRMKKIILQVAEQQRGLLEGRGPIVHADALSMMILPRSSTRPVRPGSVIVVASGCSNGAGPSMSAPTGKSSRDQTVALRQPSANQICRTSRRAASRDKSPAGASASISKAGLLPIAAVRSETIRIGMSANSR